MKTLTKLSLLLSFFCATIATHAQNPCGVDAQAGYYLNPNHVWQFIDSSHYAPGWSAVSWSWDFGDGSTSTLQNPSHNYANPGNYLVLFVVTAQQAGSVTTCADTSYVHINGCGGMVQCSFTDSINGLTVFVNGTAQSNYPPLVYSWDFQDNSLPVGGTSATHTYQSPGTKGICLTVTDNNGCQGHFCKTITLLDSNGCGTQQASFTYQTSNNVVSLYSNSTGIGNHASYQWMMDGNNISNINPNTSFTYTAPAGNHTFCLKVFNGNSLVACDDTCIVINVPNSNGCSSIPTDFIYTANGNSLTVQTNPNYPTGTGFQWWLDGQSSAISTNPQYGWQGLSAGNHQVCLYIISPSGTFCDSTCKTIFISNNPPCSINAGFQYLDSGNVVTFYGLPNATGAVYHWNFGDNTNATSPTPTITHHYPADTVARTYTVCLIVTIPGTACGDSSCHTITIPPSTLAPGCHAHFSWGLANNLQNGIAFTNSSVPSGTPSTWHWDFGDGGSSTAFAPVHQYNHAGAYNVCLTVATANGCTSTFCDSVYTGQNTGVCHAEFTASHANLPCGSLSFHNASTGNYTGVLWAFGDGTSSQQMNPVHHYTSPGTYQVVLTIFGNNCQTTYTQNVTLAPCSNVQDTICGIVFNDFNNNGILDSSETPIAGAVVHIGNHTFFTDSNGYYFATLPPSNYYVYITNQQGCIATLPLQNNNGSNPPISNVAQYLIHGLNGGNFCGYNFGFNCNIVHVCGVVYYDANNNQQMDSTETGIANISVQIIDANGNAHHAYTNTYGEYCITLLPGVYTVTATAGNYSSCPLLPGSITVNAATPGVYYGANNFGIQCPPGSCDLKVSVTPHTTVTSGFPAWYSIQVCNVGFTPTSGTVNMFYPANLIFNNATPAAASVNSSTHTITWNQGNLLPTQCNSYWVNFTADASATIGTPAFTLVSVSPDANCNDANLTNNVDTLHQVVTSSWDPNNKLAYATNYDDPRYQLVSSVEANQRIEYVVNFQNEGTAPAVNVVVNDLLSTDLDLSSFELLGSSHPCIVSLNGREVNFKFSGIMLPYAIADEPGSHGWVRFAINSVNGLPAGHTIADEAAIYFDYNAAVITNDAAVVMLQPTGIEDLAPRTAVVLAPNPMSNYTQIKLVSNTEGFRFRVSDLTGRIVSDQISSNNTLLFERNHLASGIYLYQLWQHNKPVAQGKLVIE